LIRLARDYRVFLGTFIDDPIDNAHVEKLKEICADLFVAQLPKHRKVTRAMLGMLSGESITVACYRDKPLGRWARNVVQQERISRVIAFSSATVPLAEFPEAAFQGCVVDLVDVDSEKWSQYAGTMPWPISTIYKREAGKLLAEEKRIVRKNLNSIFVSSEEAELFVTLAPELSEKISVIRNGVDSEYFSLDKLRISPYSENSKNIVFTGVMSYWPNVDAVLWFNQHVMPKLLMMDNSWNFWIVGSDPDRRVLGLHGQNNTQVTGRVSDVRPYLQYAHVSVAPMRIARGLQNKILEAMSMGLPVLASGSALVGLGCHEAVNVTPVNEAEEYVDAIMEAGTKLNASCNRDLILREFSWESSYKQYITLLEQQIGADEPK